MNSWKFNSTANYTMRLAIADCLKISSEDVYKSVKEFRTGEVVLKDGRVLVLKEKQNIDIDFIKDKISDLLCRFSGDNHSDGYEEISEFILLLLESKQKAINYWNKNV